MLSHILGKPQFIKGVGDIYPIKVKDYDLFEECSKPLYLTMNHFETNGEFLLLDLIVFGIRDEEIIKQLEKLFSLALREEVHFIITDNIYGFIVKENQMINASNYDKVREIIMTQNLIFTPKVYKDPLMQQWANKVLEARSKNGIDIKFEDMVSTVSALTGKHYWDLGEYTIYQLKADFQRLCKDKQYEMSIKARLAGDDKIDIEYFAESINMFKNPYDDLFVSKDKLKNLNKAIGE